MNLKDRFIKYIAIDSMSDEESGTHPSSKKEFDFAEILISDLKELGVMFMLMLIMIKKKQ